jgi:hypothetical protein
VITMALVCAWMAVAGCGASGAGAPGTGDDAGRDGSASEESATTSATFAEVQSIFDAHCTNCHNPGALGLPRYAMLPLTADASYDALVGHAADEACGGTRVVAGDSAASYLVRKLSDTPPPCEGVRMPRAFEVIPVGPLGTADVATIRRWIDGGALRD